MSTRPGPSGPASSDRASNRASATYRSGTRSAATLCSAKAAAVPGPMAATFTPPRLRASSKCSKKRATPVDEVNTTQW